MSNFQEVSSMYLAWQRREGRFNTLSIVVSIFIIMLILMLWAPNCFRTVCGNREAEVKSNIHAIQIALERYAVDSGGYYPYMLYGGDASDTFVMGSDDSIDYNSGTINKPLHPGDLDALIKFGYLAQYPDNPFTRDLDQKIVTDPGNNGFGPLELALDSTNSNRTSIWTHNSDRSLEYVRRSVGGVNGNLMWDVSEGQRHPPWPIMVVPEPAPHWTGYQNPVLSQNTEDMRNAIQGDTEFRDDYQFWLTQGNFYYYALFEEPGGYSSFQIDEKGNPVTTKVIGFNLAGYGTFYNPGNDVYNLWGDYPERSFMTFNFMSMADLESYPDPGEQETYTGPDGRRDGVILVVDSGAEVSMPLNQQQAGINVIDETDIVDSEQ